MLRAFEEIVGKQMYSAFVRMLKQIGPDARTRRISVVVAAMLKYALDKAPAESKEGTLGAALLAIAEEPYLAHEQSPESQKLHELIDCLCGEAGMQNQRETAKGVPYSIAENAIAEFTSWYSMPWEDYY